jgi:putative Mn2+ efflux pump MntP
VLTGGEIARLVLFVLPLGLDTFALSLLLGALALPMRRRVRLALTFAAAEGVMPAIGLLMGLPLGRAIGEWSAYAAGGLLVGVGLWMWRREEGGEDGAGDEGARIAAAATRAGWGVVGLALGVSLDELVMGFSFGVLGFPLAPALVLLALQALLVSLAGQWVGKHAGKRLGERAESLVGPMLGLLGLGILFAQLLGLPL